jgi:predicted lysophospholipase L1 biosynthesis ABC-type transport system permease subunit
VTKLFLMYVPWFQELFARIAGTLAGDASRIVALSSRRNLKRTAASTFMAALIIGYGVTVIGNAASSNDFIERAVKVSVGADASVWLFNSRGAEALMSQITGLEGVSSATVETWFTVEISLGVVPVRAIDPLKWAGIAYQEPGWYDQRAFGNMTGQTTALMERGAANNRGIKLGGSYVVKVGTITKSLKIVGFFGRDMGDLWSVQNPTFYVPKSFLDYVQEKYITQTRILVKLNDGADPVAFKTAVEALSPNVQKVDITSLYSEKTINNVFLAGPRRVEELGIYFSSLVASVGVLLVVSTILRSRWKELTLMTVRGFSPRQLEASLLLENVGMSLFAAALGVAIGFVALKGQAQVFNMVVPTMLQRQVVFPMASTINLLLVIAVLLAATVAPILVAVRRITDKPSWKTEE